jgi:hypothetical protein
LQFGQSRFERAKEMSSIKVTNNSPEILTIKNLESSNTANSTPDLANVAFTRNLEFQKVLQNLLHSLASDTVGTENDSRDRSGINDPLTDFANAQVIANYQVAMANFEKAIQITPGALKNLDIDTLNQIISRGYGRQAPEVTANISDTALPGTNPTKQQVAEYIIEQCREIGIPEQLGLATASTESEMTQFNKNGVPYQNNNPSSTDWGIMQINDKAWGDRYDLNLLKTDWKYNVRAGLQILKNSYDIAIKNSEGNKGPGATNQNLARAAYSGYNAGPANVWRYRTPIQEAPKTGLYDVLNKEGYDIRDIRFWDNYQKFS